MEHDQAKRNPEDTGDATGVNNRPQSCSKQHRKVSEDWVDQIIRNGQGKHPTKDRPKHWRKLTRIGPSRMNT